MPLVRNVLRYPVIPLIVKGFNADAQELDQFNKTFHQEVTSPDSLNELSEVIKESLPSSLKSMAKPLANSFAFVGKRSLLEIGGALGAVFGGLGFAYGSSPGSWFREKINGFFDGVYERVRPVFHWGGAILGTLGVCSVGAGYFLKKTVDKTPDKTTEESK